MKLYLSSYHLGKNSQKLKKMVTGSKKVAVIQNALDCYSDESRRKQSLAEEFEDLSSLGFEPEEIDLRLFFGKADELRSRLENFGLLWVRGGNTFVLRRAMQESGLDSILVEESHYDRLVYAGYSAGICALSPSLRGIDLADDPDVIPLEYKKQTIWDGLGLISYYIAPHFRSDHPESAMIEDVVAYYKKHNLAFKTLRDGEDIIDTATKV